MLINAVKDVASALRDLIGATKNAAGKATTDPAMNVLKDCAKVGLPGLPALIATISMSYAFKFIWVLNSLMSLLCQPTGEKS
jgi:hypothetical protein